MKIKKLNSFYIINKIEKHKKLKNKLLKLIDKMPNKSADTVSKTDFNLSENYPKFYREMFYKMINPYLLKTMDFLKAKTFIMHNLWFQQYKKNSKHGWHVHPGANYTSIYYLELPEKDKKTIIFDVVSNKFIDIDIEEGDLIMFPAYLHHGSPLIDSNKRKTIISFNSSFENLTLNK
jgi:hypothetical protein